MCDVRQRGGVHLSRMETRGVGHPLHPHGHVREHVHDLPGRDHDATRLRTREEAETGIRRGASADAFGRAAGRRVGGALHQAPDPAARDRLPHGLALAFRPFCRNPRRGGVVPLPELLRPPVSERGEIPAGRGRCRLRRLSEVAGACGESRHEARAVQGRCQGPDPSAA